MVHGVAVRRVYQLTVLTLYSSNHWCVHNRSQKQCTITANYKIMKCISNGFVGGQSQPVVVSMCYVLRCICMFRRKKSTRNKNEQDGGDPNYPDVYISSSNHKSQRPRDIALEEQI